MKRSEELYQLIGNNLTKMIPDEWDKVYLYAEISPDSRTVYFYYHSSTKRELIFGQTIPEIFGVDESIYRRLKGELMIYFVELNEVSKKNSIQPWTSLTMYLDQSGTFTIDYNYDKVAYSPGQQFTIWKYEILGLQPENNFFQMYLDEYLKKNSK